MKKFLISAQIGTACLMLAAHVPAPAQIGGGFLADPQSMDTLSGAPVGGATSSNFNPINRAQNVTNQVNQQNQQNPFAPPAGAAGANPFGAPGQQQANPFGGPNAQFQQQPGAVDPFGQQPNDPFAQPQGNFQVPIEPPTLTAWAGIRIQDRNTGEVLQDAREISILATSTSNYFDDGRGGNDFRANDNIFTNIEVLDQSFISPESHVVKTKLIDTLRFVSPPASRELEENRLEEGLAADLQGLSIRSNSDIRRYIIQPRETRSLEFFSNLTPMQFAQVRVATTEPLSPLPQIIDLEREQDRKLEDWAMRFLRDYRIDPDQMDSEFFPTFLPPPPRAPNIPLPAAFTPNVQEEDEEGGAGGVGGFGPGGQFAGGAEAGSSSVFDDSVTGEPIGNASSRYF